MQIDWSRYEAAFSSGQLGQSPADEATRQAVSHLLEEVLSGEGAKAQGTCVASPPGRYTVTVLRLPAAYPIADTSLNARAVALDVFWIAIKVFKTNRDTQSVLQKVLPFQQERARTGKPLQDSPHFQRVLRGGWHASPQTGRRAYLAQEWIPGQTLAELLEETAATPLSAEVTRTLLQDLYLHIMLPIWTALSPTSGAVWDFRDANLVSAEDGHAAGRLVMIDTDSLLEIATIRPQPQRDRQEQNAFRRLRAMTTRILHAHAPKISLPQLKTRVATGWQENGLEESLHQLGLSDPSEEGACTTAHQALQDFLQDLFKTLPSNAKKGERKP